jgi:hypothetical protein
MSFERPTGFQLISQALAPASSSTTRNGVAIDMLGFDGCCGSPPRAWGQ